VFKVLTVSYNEQAGTIVSFTFV